MRDTTPDDRGGEDRKRGPVLRRAPRRLGCTGDLPRRRGGALGQAPNALHDEPRTRVHLGSKADAVARTTEYPIATPIARLRRGYVEPRRNGDLHFPLGRWQGCWTKASPHLPQVRGLTRAKLPSRVRGSRGPAPRGCPAVSEGAYALTGQVGWVTS